MDSVLADETLVILDGYYFLWGTTFREVLRWVLIHKSPQSHTPLWYHYKTRSEGELRCLNNTRHISVNSYILEDTKENDFWSAPIHQCVNFSQQKKTEGL